MLTHTHTQKNNSVSVKSSFYETFDLASTQMKQLFADLILKQNRWMQVETGDKCYKMKIISVF